MGHDAKSLHAELGDAFARIALDRENKVVLFTGTGDTFITEFDDQEVSPETDMSHMWARIHQEGMELLNNLLAVPVPMIAAVNGPATIHAELAMLCDIVIAADHAEFADLAHVPGGTVPGDGVHVVWPMLLGPNRGRYFLLTGERIGAAEARQLGMVGEVVPAGDLMATRARTCREAGHAACADAAPYPRDPDPRAAPPDDRRAVGRACPRRAGHYVLGCALTRKRRSQHRHVGQRAHRIVEVGAALGAAQLAQHLVADVGKA